MIFARLQRFSISALCVVLAGTPYVCEAQTHADIIRGTVTTDSGTAIPDADVIVTMAPARLSQATKADSAGHYSILFAGGTGDYLVHISAVGRVTFRKRVTRTGTDSIFTVDAKLARTGGQELAAVKVNATKPKPSRDVFEGATGTGADEHVVDGVNGAVSPELAGDLAALGATTPGVASTPGGLSVGGLAATQNSTTLNGMAFAGADVPRDARTTVRVTSSSYDPSLGWFGGLNENVELAKGNVFASRRAHITADASPLQYTDPVSAAAGQRFSNLNLSFGGDGAMDEDKFVYNYGAQAGRRQSDAISLANAGANLLQHAGISADSAARLFTVLGAQGVPYIGFTPGSHVMQNGSFIGRIDHAPYDWSNFQPAKTTWGLLGYAKLASDNFISASPTATASRFGSSSQGIGMLQALFSTYLHGDYLNEERSAFSYSRNRTNPNLNLPGGNVLVASSFPSRTGGLTSVAFGGNSSLQSDTRRWTWETTSSTQFYAHGRDTHKVKLDADSRFDGVSQQVNANSLGTFSYNSLADLAANQPSSFTRTLNSPVLTGSVWNGYAAIGDLWRKSGNFQLLYGARIEANRYTSAPAYNPSIESTFDLRTDNAPNTVHLSPRIGFTWVRSNGGNGIHFNRIGEFFLGPASYVRGGIGEFRSILPANLLTTASAATGLPGGAQALTCIGAATPVPAFAAYLSNPAAIPYQCLAGAAPAFTDAAPAVQLFDPTYTAPRSWRGNLSYASSYKLLTYSVEGLYSLNLNQPGRTDVNFSNAQRFTLSDEGRPVFVDPANIVTNTGAVSTVGARMSPTFGHVIDNVSNLTSRSKQVTVSLSPELDKISNWYLSLNYTLASTRAQQSGFDESTFGTPVAHQWARGDLDIRHQILLQGGYSYHAFALTFFGRLQSGLPFTPMVGGDVNGDGLANDRAFVFNPTTMTDTALASATRTLLSSSSRNVRSCLTQQLGQAAARNSCEGPWTTSLNAQLSYSGALPIT
ncbi:MAG: carboxypeptidase-like regulatory domain-containing protein, partial [Gemmatimonadaceae bacterium]